ncbi:MAG: recombinase family protein, partial [Ruminococcus sp.]|nr:recombinase family protein [Ruminococcus sp.]
MIPATKKISTDTTDKYHQLRVAAYCRVSTEQEEQQNSYQVQIDYYTDLINKNKEWELAGIFADEGISGTQTKKRTEFNKMIRLCKKRKIDLVLCKSISRFARNTVDTLEYVRQLKDLGIGVIFERENINTLTMTSEFMIALYGSFAQAESESISKNVSWGVEKAFRDGKVRYSYNNLYGYRKGADGKPEIIPEEAEVVRLIYKMYLDGSTLRQIAQHLTDLKIPKRECAEWNFIAVRSILSNEKYVGDTLLQKTYTVDCITHKKAKNNGERAKYLVTDAHDAIIDRDTYNLVQQEMTRRSSLRKKSDKCVTAQGKYSGKYALTEIMVCGECGSAYRRQTWNIHGRKCLVWRCVSRFDNGNRYCKQSPSIHEDKLHRAILSAINEYYDCK